MVDSALKTIDPEKLKKMQDAVKDLQKMNQ